MRYFLDTEFDLERHDGTIPLVSLGLVAEDDRELYVELSLDVKELNPWLQENVVPHLTGRQVTMEQARDSVIAFVGSDRSPEFWGFFADYDWVLFCSLFGGMLNLPRGWSQRCGDVMQLADHLGVQRAWFPEHLWAKHNAVDDARWTKRVFDFLEPIAKSRKLHV